MGHTRKGTIELATQGSADIYLSSSIIERRSLRRLMPKYRPTPSSNRFASKLLV